MIYFSEAKVLPKFAEKNGHAKQFTVPEVSINFLSRQKYFYTKSFPFFPFINVKADFETFFGLR